MNFDRLEEFVKPSFSWQTVVADIKQYADGEHEKRELEENVKKRLAFYKKAAAKFEGGVLSKSKGRRRLSVSIFCLPSACSQR